MVKQLIKIVGTNIESNKKVTIIFLLDFSFFERDACLRKGQTHEYFVIIMRTLWIIQVVIILLEIHLYFTGKFEFMEKHNFTTLLLYMDIMIFLII